MTSPMGAAGTGAAGGAASGSIFGPIGAIAGALIGAGVGAYGSYESGVAGQNMSNYRARVAQINAGIQTQQAQTEFAAGDIQAQQSGLKTGERMGLTRAGIGAGNLDIGSGSAKRVLSSEAELGQFEQATIRNTAARRAYGAEVGAFSDTAQADLDVAAGQQLKTAGDIGVASSLIGGATSVSDKWAKYGQGFGTPPAPFASDSAIS